MPSDALNDGIHSNNNCGRRLGLDQSVFGSDIYRHYLHTEKFVKKPFKKVGFKYEKTFKHTVFIINELDSICTGLPTTNH